ncbi:MAG: FadR/GntR family transcriptional regulator [Pseudomonadales bacterium]
MKQPTDIAKPTSRGQVTAVVDTLGRRISAGVYHQGETLPIEQELASSLGVGRNALREAVKVLSGKGMISTAPRSGTKVRCKDEWNMLDPEVLSWHADPEIATKEFMLDLIEMRRIIEPKAAELAAKRATREDVATILTAFEEMKNNADSSEARMEADIQFHSAILKATHNVVLSHFKSAIGTYLKAHFKHGLNLSSEEIDQDLDRHHQIAWAIASGKAKTAYDCTDAILSHNQPHFEDSK